MTTDQTTLNGPRPTRAYPWLLCLSTGVAAVFCLMYITKPVMLVAPSLPPPVAGPARPNKPAAPASQAAAPVDAGLLPRNDRLPGDSRPMPSRNPTASNPTRPRNPAGVLPPPPAGFEETNLRIQHILTAEGPDGTPLARIDVEVPVLYPSRTLRWTPADVAEARSLLLRLQDYQEKNQRHRAEGSELLDSWNRLIARSLPTSELRADSPSLPTNQDDAAAAPHPGSLNSAESIQLHPAGK